MLLKIMWFRGLVHRSVLPAFSRKVFIGVLRHYNAVGCCRCHSNFVARVFSSSPQLVMQQRRNLNTDEKKPVEAKDLKKRYKRLGPVSWTSMGVALVSGSIILAALWWEKQKKDARIEKQRRQAIGKSKIGGPWELVSQEGKLMSEKDFLGQWVMIYFGFTHCPDVCPDEIEKMCKITDILDNNTRATKIQPLFFTVDPERDSPEAVKKYCAEFSPRLVGFTGSAEQVKKVSRTFRVYHSEGPRDEFNDYIVDHTVIIYLVGPDGHFVDYYGQDKKAEQIADAILLHMFKFERGKKKGWW